MSKSKLAQIMSMMAIGSMNPFYTSPEPIRHRKPSPPKTEAERAKELGLKEWNFDGKVVYAATKKKALKLAKIEIK